MLQLFNALLIVVGPFMAVGLLAIPAVVQWPARPAPRPTFPRPRPRPVYRRPAMAGGYA